MGTGSPAGKPREMPSASPNTARPPKMNSMVVRGSLSYRGSGVACVPTSTFMAR